MAANPNTTLGDLRRKVKENATTTEEDTQGKRFKIVTYTSDDSRVDEGLEGLRTYYCAVCGACCLILAADLFSLPRRLTDGAICFVIQETTAKVYLRPQQKRVYLSRSDGVECQQRFECKSCSLPLAYQEYDPDSTDALSQSRPLYFIHEGVVDDQEKSEAVAILLQNNPTS